MNTVICWNILQRSASLLLPYGLTFHAICKNVTQYASLKDSLKLTYSKEHFTHELLRTFNIVARLDFYVFRIFLYIYYSEMLLILTHSQYSSFYKYNYFIIVSFYVAL